MSASRTSPQRGSTNTSRMLRYPATVFGFFVALVTNHASAIARNSSRLRDGSTHVCVPSSVVVLSSHACASAFRGNRFECSLPSGPTYLARQRNPWPWVALGTVWALPSASRTVLVHRSSTPLRRLRLWGIDVLLVDEVRRLVGTDEVPVGDISDAPEVYVVVCLTSSRDGVVNA